MARDTAFRSLSEQISPIWLTAFFHGPGTVTRRSPGGPDLEAELTERKMSGSKDAAKAGIGFGTALAIAISWTANKSIIWAIVHGVFSWFYVIYYAIKYQ